MKLSERSPSSSQQYTSRLSILNRKAVKISQKEGRARTKLSREDRRVYSIFCLDEGPLNKSHFKHHLLTVEIGVHIWIVLVCFLLRPRLLDREIALLFNYSRLPDGRHDEELVRECYHSLINAGCLL